MRGLLAGEVGGWVSWMCLGVGRWEIIRQKSLYTLVLVSANESSRYGTDLYIRGVLQHGLP